MNRFVLTRAADQDLNEIWDYIAADSIEAADRVLDALRPHFGVSLTGQHSAITATT